MSKADRPWPWSVFFSGFWGGFGRMMAAFSAVFLILPWFANASLATFESAQIGILFALFVSAIYGYSVGDRAVRDREK